VGNDGVRVVVSLPRGDRRHLQREFALPNGLPAVNTYTAKGDSKREPFDSGAEPRGRKSLSPRSGIVLRRDEFLANTRRALGYGVLVLSLVNQV
jgi:hypothetical protein